MANSFQKIAVTAATAASALSLIATTPQIVQAATITWDLKFFDDAGAIAGTGEFSYDPDTTTFVPTDPSSMPSGFTVQNDLESFTATILGEKWGFEAGPTWWAEPSRPPGFLAQTRYGFFVNENRWFFGDGFYGTRTLGLDIDLASDSAGAGTWRQFVGSPLGGPSRPPNQGFGIWTATPAPEPSSTLGLLAISVFSAFSVGKRKLNKRRFEKS